MTLKDNFWEIFNENGEDQSKEAIYRRESLIRLRNKIKKAVEELINFHKDRIEELSKFECFAGIMLQKEEHKSSLKKINKIFGFEEEEE